MRTYLGHKWRMKKKGKLLKELVINPRDGAEQTMTLQLADLQQDAAADGKPAPATAKADVVTSGPETKKRGAGAKV